MQEKTSLKFSERFSREIKRSGIKGKEIASIAGVSAGYISDLRTGKKSNPSHEAVKKFSKILQCDFHYLLTGELRTRQDELMRQAESKREIALDSRLEEKIKMILLEMSESLYQFPSANKAHRKLIKKEAATRLDELERWCDELGDPKEK